MWYAQSQCLASCDNYFVADLFLVTLPAHTGYANQRGVSSGKRGGSGRKKGDPVIGSPFKHDADHVTRLDSPLGW